MTIREFPTEIVLTTADGMPRECAIKLDYLQTVSGARIGPLLTTLDVTRKIAVREALLLALGFEES